MAKLVLSVFDPGSEMLCTPKVALFALDGVRWRPMMAWLSGSGMNGLFCSRPRFGILHGIISISVVYMSYCSTRYLGRFGVSGGHKRS
jgi:hypothetical protein